MKLWGLSKGTALLAVFAILASAVIVLPQGAQAQGKNVFGWVYDCASNNSTGARVTLVDAHAQISPVTTTAHKDTGFFIFRDPQPAYYTVRVQPDGFTHFTAESAVFRFDGLMSVPVDLCVDKMPTANRWLNVTVVDAQPASITNEAITFAEFSRGPEAATQPGKVRFERISGILSLDTKPLKDSSEDLNWVNLTNPFGTPLVRNTHYSYDATRAFNGQIQVTDPNVWFELNNTITGGSPKGWLNTTYRNVSQSSSLQHGQVTSVLFKKDGVPMPDPSLTLNFSAETGAIRITGNWT
ncbi:MAG: carboxypeptidase-like regulatory domain-containing protein, partial [Candidatus Thermoplasmatota archaeon]